MSADFNPHLRVAILEAVENQITRLKRAKHMNAYCAKVDLRPMQTCSLQALLL